MTERNDVQALFGRLERLLMDSRPVVLDLSDVPDEAERRRLVGLVRFWYRKMGGGSMAVADLGGDRVRMAPVDNPANNLIY